MEMGEKERWTKRKVKKRKRATERLKERGRER